GKLQQAALTWPLIAGETSGGIFIVNPLSGRTFATIFSTHPPVEERVKRLRAMA
ncbi:MAG: protease HtpX, partial [Planctomycetota bacterium]